MRETFLTLFIVQYVLCKRFAIFLISFYIDILITFIIFEMIHLTIHANDTFYFVKN